MNKITILQAYRVMLRYFNNLYLQTQNADLGSMMSSAALYSANVGKEPETMDPVVWHNWMDAIKDILQDQTVKFDSTELTIEQAYQASYQYFVMYCDIGCLESIAILRDLMKKDSNNIELSRWLHAKWLKALEYVLQEELSDKIRHFFTGDTTLSMRESFMVMKMFLNKWFQEKEDKQLLQLLKSIRFKNREDYWNKKPNILDVHIFDVWKQAVEQTLQQEKGQELTIFIAYKAMPRFLMLYFKDQSETIQDLIESFDIVSDKKFIVRRLAHFWLTAAVDVNTEQEELVHGLLTIHTVIDQNIAKIIIKEWLTNFVENVSQDVLNRLFAKDVASQMLWSKAFGSIIKKDRSCLLLDNEVTVLEAYYVMFNLLQLLHQDIDVLQLNEEDKPKDFSVFLRWLKLCEDICKI